MPRARKATAKTASKPAFARKPFPTREERLVMAGAKIEKYTKQVEQRKANVRKTEAHLAQQQKWLKISEDKLGKALKLKEYLKAQSDPEYKAQLAAAKKVEKEQVDQLMKAVTASGLSIEEAMQKLKG